MYSDDDTFQPKKSKQQQKREAEAAQALGTAIVELPASQFTKLMDNLDLPEKLHEALTACRSIKAHGGRRRQLQFIGKLMRSVDCEPIERRLADVRRGGQVATTQLHAIERWRDRLLSEGDDALLALLQQYPQADAKQLRQFIAGAHKEKAEQQPPRAARLLFRYLRELFAS